MRPHPPLCVDPIELELMRNLFEAAAREMGLTLQRIAFSANIKERRDFSCALFDARGELLAQAAHIPVHLGSMPRSVRAALQRLGPLDEGDAAIVNDPYAGGTHLPDITLISPIFHAGARLGYAANRAHHADVGGISPGSMTLSRHIDQEGLRIEPSLIQRGGQLDDALMARILSAVRTPDERRGDLEAQLAANYAGARAVARMVDRRGAEMVATYGNALLDYAQAFMRRAIEAIPPGEYQFEDVMDDDGAGDAENSAVNMGHRAGGDAGAQDPSADTAARATGPLAIRVDLRIGDGRATVDLSRSADQAPGCINCPEAVTRSAVYYCFACLLDPAAPLNGGCFRDIEVITRAGSLVHAAWPAAVVAGNTETSQRIVDAVLGALAQALPLRIPAASCGTMNSVALGSVAPDLDSAPGAGAMRAGAGAGAPAPWTYYETIGGGSGAGPGFAGAHAVQCHMTNTRNTPAEAIELQYPLRVRRFERAIGSGGAGAFRGGDGIIREITALADCEGTLLTDRRLHRPWGLAGGGAGSPGRNTLIRADGSRIPLAGKTRFTLRAGDTLQIITPGGGGFGEGG